MNNVPSDLNFSQIYHGMIGRDFITAFNGNFNICNTQILYLLGEMIYRVKSSNIKEFKLENNVVYYTTDEEEPKTWKAVDITAWGNISGNINDQVDLKQALDSKAALSSFNTLNNLVNTINSNLSSLTATVETAQASINDNANDIADILTELAKKVSSTNIIAIRMTGDKFEWSPDNINWYSHEVSDTMPWGNLTGNIADQTDLQAIINTLNTNISNLDTGLSTLSSSLENLTNTVTSLSSSVSTNTQDIEDINESIKTIQSTLTSIQNTMVNQDTFDSHVNNTDNPHQVTKAQVGLGSVDNTADIDKPISTPQQQYVDNAVTSGIEGLTGSGDIVRNLSNITDFGIMSTNNYFNNLAAYSSEALVFVNDYVNLELAQSYITLTGTSATDEDTNALFEYSVSLSSNTYTYTIKNTSTSTRVIKNLTYKIDFTGGSSNMSNNTLSETLASEGTHQFTVNSEKTVSKTVLIILYEEVSSTGDN